MTGSGRRRRRRSRRRGDAPAGDAPEDIRSRPITSSLTPLDFLASEQVEAIHTASLHILAQTGVRFDSDGALDHFRTAGARVEGDRVFLEEALLHHCLQSAPARYTLHARNPAHNVTVGGDACAVMPAGGPPYVLDLDGQRRPGTLADVEAFTRLSAMAPEVQVVTRKPVEAQDVPPAARHLDCWLAALTLADKPVQSGFVGGRAEAEDALQMLAILFGGEDEIDGVPVAHCSVNVNSPLSYDRPMLESLLAFARYGQPVLVSPFVMAGVSGPTTLAGALAQHNAEVLAGVALTQLARPGTPVLYGTATSNVDMRTGAPAIGSPESALAIAACAQLARHYGLPCRGGGALTDSPVPDAQSHYERTLTVLISVLGGVDFMMHGVGLLESYLTISYEQFVLDLELLAMVRHLLQPLDISAETLALDAIDAVGPGGYFLDAEHTMRHFRDAHFLPQISRRQRYEEWQAAGGQDARQRANERCRRLLAEYRRPDLPSDVTGRLHDFVRRRKRQL